MRKNLSIAASQQRRQVYALLLSGIVLLLLAWQLPLNPFAYPVGVLLLGLGMLLSTLFYPDRLLIASYLTSALGIAVFLGFKGLIPGGQIFPAYILALGVGLLAIAFATKRGHVGAGALSPALIVILVGLIEVLLVKGATPAGLIPFALSLWLPGSGLLLLGIIYFLAGMRS